MKSSLSIAILLVSCVLGSGFLAEPLPTAAMPLHPWTLVTANVPESWWQKLLRIAGISAAPTRQRGPGETPKPGDIYVYNLVRKTDRKLASGNYSSPIFLAGDDKILALTGNSIVRIPVSGGAGETFSNNNRIVKLVGQSMDDPKQVLVLTSDGNQTSVGILSLVDFGVTVIPHETETEEGKAIFARITGGDRNYCGTEVYEELQCERDSVTNNCKLDEANRIKKQWSDIMIAWPFRQPVNITKSTGDYCRQPALSLDAQQVVYIRTKP